MCGMYFVDDELEDDIERLIMMVNRERKQGAMVSLERTHDETAEIQGKTAEIQGVKAESQGIPRIGARIIRPTDMAPVLAGYKDGVIYRSVRWGLPGFQKGQVIFNARCETALERPTFRAGVRNSRIVIPAAHFFEWNARKEKNTFRRKDGKPLYFAGFCQGMGEDERFAMLTTAANASMAPVHDRMPLILEESEIEPWLYQEDWTESLLRKIPGELSREAEYEQLSLFS